MMRPNDRANDELRPIRIERHYTKFAEGSVLVGFGETRVLCTATAADNVPGWLRDSGSGWVTAEYAMLPRCAQERIGRESVRKGRALEIGRLIGRSLRCVVDLEALGVRQVILDCDVLQADGGTRTAAITGAYVALHDALTVLRERGSIEQLPLLGQCAAVSVGIIDGEARLDLCYEEDAAADVDMNLVMRDDGYFIEVQGAAEGEAFSRALMNDMLDLAEGGIRTLFNAQKEALGLE